MMRALLSHCFWDVWFPFVPSWFGFYIFLSRKLWLISVVPWKRFYLWSLKFGIWCSRLGIWSLKLGIENLKFGIESLMLRHCHCVIVCSCWNLGHLHDWSCCNLGFGALLNCCIFFIHGVTWTMLVSREFWQCWGFVVEWILGHWSCEKFVV